jgi:S-adenosyl methyltransferase
MSRETAPAGGAPGASAAGASAAGASAAGGSAAGNRPVVDTSVAHSARVHDYWLGGKDNFAADRAAGDAVLDAYPGIVMSVRANRAFLARAVRFLTEEAGIRQFLDIGTGIPASNNTHEVAQHAAPQCRVVYVDYDRCKSGCAHADTTRLRLEIPRAHTRTPYPAGMRSRLRSVWADLLHRIPARLPVLAASAAVVTAMTPPGTLREIGVSVVVIALLGKGGAFARALSCGVS